MSHDLTRWIEDAEARQFRQAVVFERRFIAPVARHHPLAEAIGKMPYWFHALTHVGCTRSYKTR
jgi:hypothetical protein